LFIEENGGNTMEGVSVITFQRYQFKTAQVSENYWKWSKASHSPMLMSSNSVLCIEHSFPLEDKKTNIIINHFQYFENYFAYLRSPERAAHVKDNEITLGDQRENPWRALYFVVRSFKGTQFTALDKGAIIDKTTYLKEFTEENAPAVAIKGLRLSQDEWEKYDAWMNEWGYDIYLPVLLKSPGIIEYTRCWLSNVNRGGDSSMPKPSHSINTEFPEDLSIMYFENMRAYQNFCKSKELAAFEKNLATTFPGGLKYK
jgi:hypothetical protein